MTKTYDDGRMDIVAEGRDRFELLEVNQERAFLRGSILLVRMNPTDPRRTNVLGPSNCTARFSR